MRYVQRDPVTGKITGHFANEQSYATEYLADDHPDMQAFHAERERVREENRKLSVTKRVPLLEARVTELERIVAELKSRS